MSELPSACSETELGLGNGGDFQLQNFSLRVLCSCPAQVTEGPKVWQTLSVPRENEAEIQITGVTKPGSDKARE